MERRINKMKKYFKLLLPIFLISLITLLLFLVGCAPSVPTTPPVSTKATIEGRIMVPGSSTKDISGWVPLPNAVITLTDSEGKIHTVTTDSEGYYTLFDIPPGINYIITATGKVGENTVVLKDIIPKVETGKNYDAGTADSESTALALVVEALLAEGLTPEEIDLEEIQNTDNFSELVSQVTSALEENGDVTTDPDVEDQVEEIEEEIVLPETPEPEPEPEPSLGGGGGGAPAPPPVNPNLKLIPSTQSVIMGSQATIDVVVEDVTDLRGANIILNFDPVGLQYVSSADGGFIPPIPDAPDATLMEGNIDNTNGTVTLDIAGFGVSAYASGTGTIMIVVFDTIDKGNANITFGTTNLRDKNNKEIIHTQGSGCSVTIN